MYIVERKKHVKLNLWDLKFPLSCHRRIVDASIFNYHLFTSYAITRPLFYLLDVDVPMVKVPSTTPKEGETVNFTCDVVTSDSILNYTWFRDNVQLTGQNARMFRLEDGNRSNSANYSCKVTTVEMLEATSAHLTITYLCKCNYVFDYILYYWHHQTMSRHVQESALPFKGQYG